MQTSIKGSNITVLSSGNKERVLDIWRDAVDATHGFLSFEDRLAIEEEVVVFLPQAPLLFAVDEAGETVGFMLLSEGHLEALFIDLKYHRQGVGRVLVDYALKQYPGLTVDVNEQNIEAMGFYTHLGFEQIGRSEKDGQGRDYPLVHLRYMAYGLSQST